MSHPSTVLRSLKGAFVLSASDNHVNLVVTTNSGEQGCASLMKLATVAPHKDVLSVTKRFATTSEIYEYENNADDGNNTKRIQSFLSNLSYQLTSESGAEYSYYTVSLGDWWNKIHGFLSGSKSKPLYTMELISPASERQISRCLPGECRMVQETPELYEMIVKPLIQTTIESGSLGWIANVINGTKEQERLLLDHSDFILNVDTKWRSHPDPLTTPRDSWYGHSSVQDLYCLAIVKDTDLASMRDLRQHHLPMLMAIQELGCFKIREVYGIDSDQLRVFCHYQPQFYQFHVHFTRLHNEIGCQVERGHLISDIIQNLQLEGDYYAKRTITYKLKTSSDLYQRMTQQQNSI